MARIDIDSLSINIFFQKTIGFCVENVFKDRNRVDDLLEDSSGELFTKTMPKVLILFDQEFYKQHDGVAKRSPLAPTR